GAAALTLPRRARRWRALQRERVAHALLLEGMAQQLAGRYLRGRKAAEAALAHTGVDEAAARGLDAGDAASAAMLSSLAHLLAAESAHALQDQATRDTHLTAALQTGAKSGLPPEVREGITLRAAYWALHDRDPEAALTRLAELPVGAVRRAAALRLKLMAAQKTGRHAEALETARLLAKHRAFSPAAAASLIRGLTGDLIASVHDPQQLQTIWQSLNPNERAMPDLALRAAQRLVALGGDAYQARLWLRAPLAALLDHPDVFDIRQRARLIGALERSFERSSEQAIDPEWLARIEAAQTAHPADATLQYLTGMVCLHRELWGKAKALLTQAARGLDGRIAADGADAPDPEIAALRRRAWRALATLAEREGDAATAAQAWRQAGRG
ncbi:MAG: heme biosynthesis protein HemY, partial [Burkholderiaceae bacterium]|nr:heme biosynthesis protein HemY [Burkholderiaceae bacterium]